MPVVTQPNLIELSDLSGGYAPDGLHETTDQTVLVDAMNVLLDRNSGALQTRPGFARLFDLAQNGYVVKQMFHYTPPGENFLVVVLTTETSGADNVMLYAYDLDADSAARIDTAGVDWDNPTAMFWFMSIDGLLYGGSKGNPMFSWDPDTDTWDGDVSTGNWKEWVDNTDGGVDTANEYAKDFAWTGKERTWYNTETKVYIPQKNIRYDTWESGERYQKGDRVSLKAEWDTGVTYWKSFRCVDSHIADAAKKPQLGVDSNDFWQKVKLSGPKNDDNETSDAWARVPLAAQTSIAAWYADRLWLRFDGQGDNSRMQYSAPVKAEKGEDIPDVEWDPTNFAPGSDFRGTGGGWWPFNDGKNHGHITAAHAFGQYLLVFKRRAVYALSGTDDTSFQVRHIGRASGCVGQQAVVEMSGLVFFLSDQGLRVTDGTVVEPATGAEKFDLYLKDLLDSQMTQAKEDGREAQLAKWNGFIVITLPDDSRSGYLTFMYEPQSGSFWPTDLPVLDWCNFRLDGIDHYAFTADPSYGNGETLVYEFDAGETVDDDGEATQGEVSIEWRLQTSWLIFGLMNEMRRIRRVWWSIFADPSDTPTVDIKVARDWAASFESTKTVTPVGSAAAEFIEGEYVKDSSAISMYLGGDGAPVHIYGTAVHSQPRRRRYHA